MEWDTEEKQNLSEKKGFHTGTTAQRNAPGKFLLAQTLFQAHRYSWQNTRTRPTHVTAELLWETRFVVSPPFWFFKLIML